MDKKELIKLQLAMDEADTWTKRYEKITNQREALKTSGAAALKTLKGALIPVTVGDHTYQVLPLSDAQLEPLKKLARYLSVKPIRAADAELLAQLDSEVPKAIAEASQLTSSGRGKRVSEDALDAADFLSEYVPWGLAENLTSVLDRVAVADSEPAVRLDDALSPTYGLDRALRKFGTPSLIPADEIRGKLATFTSAERYAELARALTPQHKFAVVCSPDGASAADLLAALEVNESN